MKEHEDDAMKGYHRSPEPSPEEKVKHHSDAARVNYRIAINELNHLKRRSALQSALKKQASKERTWTDNKGTVWAVERNMYAHEREQLEAVLKVIRSYELEHGDRLREDKTLDSIVRVREANREQDAGRLVQFEMQVAGIDPSKPAPDNGRRQFPEQEHDIEP